jgi:HSF-type DNA-binding
MNFTDIDNCQHRAPDGKADRRQVGKSSNLGSAGCDEEHRYQPAHPVQMEPDTIESNSPHRIIAATYYTDRSGIPASLKSSEDLGVEVGQSKERSLMSLNPNQNSRNRKLIQFPVRLYAMLERIGRDGRSHVVSWQPHGRCFVIHVPRLFEQLLSVYFPGIGKLSSFRRQVCCVSLSTRFLYSTPLTTTFR